MLEQDLSHLLALLEEYDIFPNTDIGQHFLFDRTVLEAIINLVTATKVIEIGSGIGNLTEPIAQGGRSVHGFEIDRQFEPLLDTLIKANPSIKITFGDALRADFAKIIGKVKDQEEWQVVANLPYHISEPFIKKLLEINIESAVLLVGQRLAEAMMASGPESPFYTKTSLIVQAFFEPVVVRNVPRGAFYPEPRTESTVVVLIPRSKEEYQTNKLVRVLRQLVLSERDHSTVRAALKEALDTFSGDSTSKVGLGKRDGNRANRRAGRAELKQYLRDIQHGVGDKYESTKSSTELVSSTQIIERLGLPERVLSTPFSTLDNQNVKALVMALEKMFGV